MLLHSLVKNSSFDAACRIVHVDMYPVCSMIMHNNGIAAAAHSGRTTSSARIPALLHHLVIAPRHKLTDTLHLKGRLFIISAYFTNKAVKEQG